MAHRTLDEDKTLVINTVNGLFRLGVHEYYPIEDEMIHGPKVLKTAGGTPSYFVIATQVRIGRKRASLNTKNHFLLCG